MSAGLLATRAASLLAVYPRHAQAAALVTGLAGSLLVRSHSLVLLAAAGVCAVAAVELAGVLRAAAVGLALVLAGSWWGGLRLEVLQRSVLRAEVGEAAPALVSVTGPVRRGSFAQRMPAEVRRFGRLRLREPVLLELPLGRAPPQGAVLRVIAKVEQPRPPSDGFDERAWLARQGRHVVVRADRFTIVGRRGGLPGLADRLRERLRRTIAPGLSGERRAVVAGVVLGEDEGLTGELGDAFRASGLYHLLAVSGQNVAFIAGGVMLLAWLAGVGRLTAEIGVLTAIGAYVLAVGWQPSVVRAGVAGALASLAWLAARPRDRSYFLLAGAAVLLAWNPYSLLEPGFQLSFAAVLAIFAAVPVLQRRLEGYPFPRPLADVVAVSAVCGLATAPIAWLHFGAVPTYSLPANALAAPVMGPLLGLGLLAALVYPVLPSAALAIAWLNGWLAAYLAACARVVASLPLAQITSGTVLAAAGLVAALGVSAMRVRDRRVRLGLSALGVAAAVALAGYRLVTRPAPLPPAQGLRVVALDVGQGDAILIQAPGANVLVDEGPPEGRAAAQLRRLGVRRLQLLVLTHPQRDHIGGAVDVLRSVRVDAVLVPGLGETSADARAALRQARDGGARVLAARRGDAYRLGRLRLRVLWPDGRLRPGEDPNESAVILVASVGGADALLTADAEANVTLPLGPPPVEILKVAHHGSADDLLPELLRRVRPRVALISVGRVNDYGHPTPSTLGALERADVQVYRTDRDGRVTVEAARGRLVVGRQR